MTERPRSKTSSGISPSCCVLRHASTRVAAPANRVDGRRTPKSVRAALFPLGRAPVLSPGPRQCRRRGSRSRGGCDRGRPGQRTCPDRQLQPGSRVHPARGDAPRAGREPCRPRTARRRRGRVPFPYWEDRFGWNSTGSRTDRVDGRSITTVFYTDSHGRRIGYAILAGSPAPQVAGGVIVGAVACPTGCSPRTAPRS